MTTFREHQHPRETSGTGRFAVKARSESEIALSAPEQSTAREQMRQDDPEADAQVVATQRLERAHAHWSEANQERARAVIARMDGVDAVELDPTEDDDPERGLVKVGGDYGKAGTLTYKGQPMRFTVREGVGTVSGSGFISVVDDNGRELGRGSYSIPRTEGGQARPDNSRLGDSIEEGLLTRRLARPLQEIFTSSRTPAVRAFGGRAALAIDDYAYGGAGLMYHGGRKWSGYGGPAYGDQAAQRRAAVRALGEGSETRGKKRLAELNALLSQTQAAHDALYPPTREQAKRRR